MSFNKPTNLGRLRDHYGLALEEIKLERSISNMTALLASHSNVDRLVHLQNEISQQKRQLKSLRRLRGEHQTLTAAPGD